jgi:hypothetical protein
MSDIGFVKVQVRALGIFDLQFCTFFLQVNNKEKKRFRVFYLKLTCQKKVQNCKSKIGVLVACKVSQNVRIRMSVMWYLLYGMS